LHDLKQTLQTWLCHLGVGPFLCSSALDVSEQAAALTEPAQSNFIIEVGVKVKNYMFNKKKNMINR
jgi:hypothetical protein